MTMETARPADPADYPTGGTFADLLSWHINWGTRPGCSTTSQQANTWWKEKEITAAIYGLSITNPQHERAIDSAKKTTGNWKAGRSKPGLRSEDNVGRLFRALFGNDEALHYWEDDLSIALKNGRTETTPTRSSDFPGVAKFHQPVTPRLSVPFPTAHLCGRDREVDGISASITSENQRATLLLGGPGAGKTELAKAVAHHKVVAEHFGNQRWFVSLSEATTVAAMRHAVISALGGAPAKGLHATLDLLGDKPGLLVIDGLQTPWEIVEERQGVETVLGELARAPGLSLLATLQGRDRPREPSWKSFFAEALDMEVSKQLLEDIAGPWVLDDPRLNDFLTALGGLPLAVKLLAHRAEGRVSLAPLWREWLERGVDSLTLPDEPIAPSTSFSHSISLTLASARTTPGARQLFAMLGRLPQGMLDEHAATVFGDGAINSLLRVGLAVERSGRIELLAPVKDFALRKLELREDDENLTRSHYLNLVAKLGIEAATPADNRNIRRLEADVKNLEWAIINAIFDREPRLSGVAEALRGLYRFIEISNCNMSIFARDDDSKYKSAGDGFVYSYKYMISGILLFNKCDFHTCNYEFHRAAMFLGATKNDEYISRASIYEAESLRRYGKNDQASALIRKVLDRLDIKGDFVDRSSRGYAYLTSARISQHDGLHDQAFDEYMWATNYADEGDLFLKAQGLVGLGDGKVIKGDFDFGRGLIEEALLPFQHMGSRYWEAVCLDRLGRIDLQEEKFEDAQSKLDDALSIFRELEHYSGQRDASQGLEELARNKNKSNQ